MSDFGMMPSYWVGGNPNAGFQANLAQNQAAMANNQNFFNGIQNIGGQNQASLNNAYGPSGFGGDTARYAALGAAYGRNTGGFNAGKQVAPAYGQTMADFQGRGTSPASVNVDSSPFDTGNAGAVPHLFGGGMPFGGGGFGRPPSVFDTGAQGIPNLSGGGMPFGGGGFNPGQQPASGPMDFNQLWSSRGAPGLITNNYFNDITAQSAKPPTFGSGPAGGRSFIEPDMASNPGQTGIPSSQRLLGYDPAQSAAFAPGSGDSFQSRFGMGFRNAGTPNQYTTEPYTDVGGTIHQPNIPPGFQSLFSADNPGGALPAGGFRSGGNPPIMNQGGDESSDTLTASDRAAAQPFPSGGASPFPFAGSYQGSMRDKIASAITGGSSFASGSPTVMQPTPSPTQPQMNNAQDMLRQGRGWTIAQPVPPPQSGYAPINQAISSIGSVSRPGMFDNLKQPLGSMFSPGQYRGLGR